jgi:hypothetical protein
MCANIEQNFHDRVRIEWAGHIAAVFFPSVTEVISCASGLIVRDNLLQNAADFPQAGSCIRGKSRYNANSGRNITVSGNPIACGDMGFSLNGVDGATIGAN